jgi:hypothetical protein
VARLTVAILCAAMSSICGSLPTPTVSHTEACAAAEYLSQVILSLTTPRSYLTRSTRATLDHLAAALVATSRLFSLMQRPPPASTSTVHQAYLDNPPSPSSSLPSPAVLPAAMRACLSAAVDAALDPLETQLASAFQRESEKQAAALIAAAYVINSAGDLLVMQSVLGGNNVRSRLCGLLLSSSSHASEGLTGRPEVEDVQWEWDCREMGALSGLWASKLDPPQASALLCQQLSSVLAQCAVSKRCACDRLHDYLSRKRYNWITSTSTLNDFHVEGCERLDLLSEDSYASSQ